MNFSVTSSRNPQRPLEGVVAALQLQQRGIPVLLVDKDGPAQVCSSGNAGILTGQSA